MLLELVNGQNNFRMNYYTAKTLFYKNRKTISIWIKYNGY